MKSILAGAWPALKPLPVFKYEAAEYRATIDFDKLRGEWVCRKTSLPSNKVQELRGELREITLALPHGETEILIEGGEGQELEKDTNRRLQALRDWRENHENGARYFELRSYLSEGQRAEIDDSLRFSLTARQLQFNPKNIDNVFEALSTAGGRFAALIEFAKRNKAKQQTAAQAQTEELVPEAEPVSGHDQQSLEISSCESNLVLNEIAEAVIDPVVRDRKPGSGESCPDPDEPPAVSTKNVFPELYQVPTADRVGHTAPEQSEIETPEIVDAHSASLVEHPDREGPHSPGLAGFAAQMQASPLSMDRSGSSSTHFPVLEISVFHLAVFAALFFCGVIAFAVGLTMGRGPLGSHLGEVPKSMLGFDANSPAPRDHADEPSARIPISPVANSDKSTAANRLNNAASSEEIAKIDIPRPQPSAESPHSPKLGGMVSSAPSSPASSGLASTIVAPPHLTRPATILVDLPSRGSQPFRVSFPERTFAATSSVAMSSQLSVLVSPELGPAGTHKSARLEAGGLVSFVWPRYPRPGDRYGSAQVIRVRATIGPLGQVRDVRFLSGSASLLPATTRAIRQWRYTPTLLDKRPVQAQQDLTIEFRPPQYSSRISTRRPN